MRPRNIDFSTDNCTSQVPRPILRIYDNIHSSDRTECVHNIDRISGPIQWVEPYDKRPWEDHLCLIARLFPDISYVLHSIFKAGLKLNPFLLCSELGCGLR
jgi:hypothetical protein